jgi:hypothetical protein
MPWFGMLFDIFMDQPEYFQIENSVKDGGLAMINPTIAKQTSVKTAQCPYCSEQTSVNLPGDYEPVYIYCGVCGKKFIAERLSEGFQVLTLEGAPCWSDPDCRGIEMGGSDEE